jgi:hypothetical protein
MLKLIFWRGKISAVGDILIEVTLAAAIVIIALNGSAALTSIALRSGLTAKETNKVAAAAQARVEALRNFMVAHLWSEFRNNIFLSAFNGFLDVYNIITRHTDIKYAGAEPCFQ